MSPIVDVVSNSKISVLCAGCSQLICDCKGCDCDCDCDLSGDSVGGGDEVELDVCAAVGEVKETGESGTSAPATATSSSTSRDELSSVIEMSSISCVVLYLCNALTS